MKSTLSITIAWLYTDRLRVDIVFKWVKQHLRIKEFYGASSNAEKTQIGVAISVNMLVAILKKRLGLGRSLYTILQIWSVIV